MAQQVALNIDCLEYMRTLPDKAFDLAVVDPPYGDGNGGSAKRFGGMFGAVYGENTRAHVADAHERETAHRSITDSVEDLTSTKVAQIKRAAKKSWRGMLPQRSSIFKSFSASHAIRSFGAETIFLCRRRAVF